MTRNYYSSGCGHPVWRFKKENGVVVYREYYSAQTFGYNDDITINKRNRRVFRMLQTKARKKAGII